MHRLNKFAAVLSLAVAIIASGSVTAFAKSNNSQRSRPLSGIVLSVDRAERTLLVRELGTNQTYKVQLPAGGSVRTNQVWAPSAGIEQISAGTIIYDANVR